MGKICFTTAFALVAVLQLGLSGSCLAHAPVIKEGWPLEFLQEDSWLFFGGPTNMPLTPQGTRLTVANVFYDGTQVNLPDGRYYDGWPFVSGRHEYQSPAVADLDGDGFLEVVTAASWTEDTPPWSIHAELRVISESGDLWDGYPYQLPFEYSSIPITADIDRDGILEIVVFAQYGGDMVWVMEPDGYVEDGWPVTIDETWGFIAGTGAVGDLTGDGYLEVVIPGTDNLYAWDHRGRSLPGFPVNISYMNMYVSEFTGVVLGDLEGDGSLDIILGTYGIRPSRQGCLAVYESNGQFKEDWPYIIPDGTGVTCVPSLGDVNGDGRLEIFFSSGWGNIYLLNYKAEALPGWPLRRMDEGWPLEIKGQPAIVDITDDGRPDLIAGSGLHRQDGPDTYGYIWAWEADATTVEGYPWRSWVLNYTCPAFSDFDGDGNLDMFVYGDFYRNYLSEPYRVLALCDMGVPYNPETVEWGEYGHDRHNSNNYHYVSVDLTGVEAGGAGQIRSFRLVGNYPNPFNARTTVYYQLSQDSEVELSVYDLLGRHVETVYCGQKPAGAHSYVWNASALSSGIYLLKLSAGDHSATRKVTLLK